MRKLLFLLFALAPAAAVATTPTVSTITGVYVDQGTFTITGANFDTKSPAAPLLWAPFRTSASPDALGQYSAFAQNQNMAYDATAGYDGSGGMQGTAGNGTWTLRVDASGFGWNDFSAKYLVMSRSKQNYLVPYGSATNNQKNHRNWPAGGSGYSNLYWSIHNGRVFVENIGGSTDSGFWSSGVNPNTTNYYFQEILVQASSALGVKDGALVYRINGTQRSSGSLITKSVAAPASWKAMYPAQIVIANKGSWTSPAWSVLNNAWVDDLYVDNTQQRILLCDAATYTACRKFAIGVPTAWSNTSVSGVWQIHGLDLAPQSTAYAYVFNQSNTPNAAGKQVLIGGSGGGAAAPTVTRVNVSTGSYLGGTVSTATCTGLTATPTVLIGTQAATGIVMTSATSIRFTIPAHSPPGDSGLDLVITNPDGQYGVLAATMSYDSPVANQAPYSVDAGDNYFLTLPGTMPLSGNALDDGLPNPPHALTYLWQQKSGPGTVTFGDATALTTTASFSVAGTYTISLTANDSALQTESASIIVLVSAAIGVAIPPWKP